MTYRTAFAAEAPWQHSLEPFMRKLFLIAALVVLSSTASAQTPAAAEPAPPMVPSVKPALGPASRAMRHEIVSRDRVQRVEEKAEDRADAMKKRKGPGDQRQR